MTNTPGPRRAARGPRVLRRPNAERRRPVKVLPLDGILVADFSRVLAGPLCTQMLGDAGARVIKVEEPQRGDETRRWGPPFVNGVSAYFLSVNRNKESLALNLKSPQGKKLARELIRRADVVVDNFLPSQRIDLGLENVRRINPRAIHLSITGVDADSSDPNAPGYDLLAQAASGLMSITGDAEPMKAGVALADVMTGYNAVAAIAAALYAREKTGKGQRLELSLFSTAVSALVNVAQTALVSGEEAERYGNAHPSIVPYQMFHASDRPFVIGAGTDRHFVELVTRVLRRAELANDERFDSNAKRVENRDVLVPMLEAEFAKRKARDWVARCRKSNVPAAVAQGVREALSTDDGALLLIPVKHRDAGRYMAVANPLRVDGVRFPVRLPPPRLGEQTEAILRELQVK